MTSHKLPGPFKTTNGQTIFFHFFSSWSHWSRSCEISRREMKFGRFCVSGRSGGPESGVQKGRFLRVKNGRFAHFSSVAQPGRHSRSRWPNSCAKVFWRLFCAFLGRGKVLHIFRFFGFFSVFWSFWSLWGFCALSVPSFLSFLPSFLSFLSFVLPSWPGPKKCQRPNHFL